jgi:hypothetical protein
MTMSKMTIDEKYESGNMSAFEKKVYEHQQAKIDKFTKTSTASVYDVDMWDNDKNDFYTVSMDIEDVISDPKGIHFNNLARILINHLRKQRGLELFDENFRLKPKEIQ